MPVLSIQEAKTLSMSILQKHGTSKENALSVTDSLLTAQIEGKLGHGFLRLLSYVSQLKTKKIDGRVKPSCEAILGSILRVDAKHGFAYPAIDLAITHSIEMAKKNGVAISSVANSHHAGMLGYFSEKIAKLGYMSIIFSNSPQAMAPWGGTKAVFGTNPIAFATPRKNNPPLVIDMSLSKVARGKILASSKGDNVIPQGWALDSNGEPTTNAKEALKGVLLPIGEEKGSALCMMIEIFTACLSGSNIGCEASSLLDDQGVAPSISQCLLVFDQNAISQKAFENRLEDLCQYVLEQEGTRLPGDKKSSLYDLAKQDGVEIQDEIYKDLMQLL